MEGSEGGCGRPASGGLSFLITKSVTTKHPMDVTSPVPTHCPQLSDNVTATLSPPIGWMDSAIRDKYGGVCVGGGGTGRRMCRRARLPPVPARLSPTTPLPPCGGDSREPVRSRNTDGRPSIRRRSLIAGVRLHTKTTLLQYYKQFHAVTK